MQLLSGTTENHLDISGCLKKEKEKNTTLALGEGILSLSITRDD